MKARRLALFGALGALLLASLVAVNLVTSKSASAAPAALHVVGNQLQDSNGVVVIPRGVNRSGTEYMCVQNAGIFDGPSNQTSVAAMASWGVKSVRVPLNEDCWLGINGVNPSFSGQNYITAITNYVALLHSNGMYAEITDMWGAPGTTLATSSPAITNASHSPAFWTSVANTFKNDGATFFGLMNEPHNVTAGCWLNGGSACNGQVSYTAAGAQSLVTAIRNTGATNVIADQCIDYANNCSGWLQNEPVDPLHNLIAEAHIYGKNTCDTVSCFNSQIAPVAAQVPVIFGETGETFDGSDCNNSSTNISAFMGWADQHNIGYQAWVWDTWGSCNLSLITNYNGTPFGVYGNFVKSHLLAEAGSPPPTPTTPPSATATSTSVPPTPTATSVPPTPTVVPPTPTPPTGGSLSRVQSISQFIDYSGANPTTTDFANPIGAGHLLVAVVAVAGGNPYTVGGVTDDLGNTWHKAASGVNGDETDVEVWYAISASAGADGVYAALVRGTGGNSTFAQSYITIAEYNGSAVFHAGHSAGSSNSGAHSSGSFATSANDLVVGGYSDAGYVGTLSITDGKSLLGTKFDGIDAIQAIQSDATASGTSASVSYADSVSSYAEVTGASFTPTGGGSAPVAPSTLSSAPCVVTVNGVSWTGHCSGTFTEP